MELVSWLVGWLVSYLGGKKSFSRQSVVASSHWRMSWVRVSLSLSLSL
jgi:hypothetical protein